MGSGGSKQEQYTFNPDAPVRFSQSVINSLQNNPETDSTRARDKELQTQARVNAELAKVRDTQAQQLSSLTASLTTDLPEKTTAESSSSSTLAEPRTGLAFHLSSPFYQDHSSKSTTEKKSEKKMEDSGRSHASVNQEVAELRAKLAARKSIEQLPPAVEQAKTRLVSCLRTNDRRPLDCWQEVESFKAEVGKMERAFIEKAGR